MNSISKKIDFVSIVTCDGANPNGDPLSGNIPRTDMYGYGELSDVCLKHKIRRRMAMMAAEGDNDLNDVLIVDSATDGRAKCIMDKLEQFNDLSTEEKRDAVCAKFRDVRAFGFLWAASNGDGKGESIGIQGPVSIMTAKSVGRVNPVATQVTKCISMSAKDGKRGSDTMGMKYRIDRAAYVIKGTVNAYMAEKTGFSDEDAAALKEALKTLFLCDESAARPSGSMTVEELFWMEHPSKMGSAASGNVFRAIDVQPKDDVYPYYEVKVNREFLDKHGISVDHWKVMD